MSVSRYSPQEIVETIRMVQMENLDIRTIAMGISLRACAHPDLAIAATKAYDKICRVAEKLVRAGKERSRYGRIRWLAGARAGHGRASRIEP